MLEYLLKDAKDRAQLAAVTKQSLEQTEKKETFSIVVHKNEGRHG